MPEIELKPCPFCGSKELNVKYLYGKAYIQCEKCLAETACKDNLNSAFEAWNRRTDDIKKKCPNCGKEFFPLAVNQIYCSTKCRSIFYRSQKLEQED